MFITYLFFLLIEYLKLFYFSSLKQYKLQFKKKQLMSKLGIFCFVWHIFINILLPYFLYRLILFNLKFIHFKIKYLQPVFMGSVFKYCSNSGSNFNQLSYEEVSILIWFVLLFKNIGLIEIRIRSFHLNVFLNIVKFFNFSILNNIS